MGEAAAEMGNWSKRAVCHDRPQSQSVGRRAEWCL